jgi:hypothetical protein
MKRATTIFELLDRALAALGWTYDRKNERFMAGNEELTWDKIIGLLPSLTLEQPDAQPRKIRPRRARKQETR